MSWLEHYGKKYGDRLRRAKAGVKRVMRVTGLPEKHARVLNRYVKNGEILEQLPPPPGFSQDTPPTPAPEERADPNQYLHSKSYIYNEEDDTYITFLPDVPKPLVLPGEVHREIVRAYSNFDGAPASVNQIARTVQLPRAWVVKYLRIHEITHDREPFTPEEMLTRTDDELVSDALQLRRATVYKKLESAKWREIREDAMKWRSFKDHTIRAITSALKDRPVPEVPRIELRKARTPYAAVVGMSDFHWGKYSDAGENFESYNREIARNRLFEATANVANQLAMFGRPEVMYVPIGSDFLHIDTDLGTTTRGTHQDMDGTPAEILVTACELMEGWINCLRQIGPVELVLMSGNHDRMTGLAILLYLDALFRNAPNVTARMDRTPRTYRSYGSNLIGFVHGDGVKKTTDMAGHMARECARDWAKCQHRTIYTGHFHNEKTETDTVFSVTRRQLPSLSGPDRWHSRHGFEGAPKSLPLYLHAKDTGLMAVLYGKSSV